MGKKVNYDKWTIEQLNKQAKTLKFTTGLLGGLLIVLFGTTIYLSITEKRFHPLLISPIVLSAIIPLNMKRMKKIKAEIERRH